MSKLLKIKGPVVPGQLVPAMPTGARRSREMRFLNFARDANGRAFGAPFEATVEDCHYYRRLLHKGVVTLADAPSVAAKPAKKGGAA